jgi:hypothetical protein
MLEAVEGVVVDERPHRIERRDGLAGKCYGGKQPLAIDVGDGIGMQNQFVGHSRFPPKERPTCPESADNGTV